MGMQQQVKPIDRLQAIVLEEADPDWVFVAHLFQSSLILPLLRVEGDDEDPQVTVTDYLHAPFESRSNPKKKGNLFFPMYLVRDTRVSPIDTHVRNIVRAARKEWDRAIHLNV